MALSQMSLDARLLMPSIRRAMAWFAVPSVARLRYRPTRLVEETMPDWQLRDLGFRDGRATAARTDEFG